MAVAGVRTPAVSSRPRWARDLGDDRFWRHATLAPALLVLLLLTAVPLANLFVMSFFDVRWANGAAVRSPVGLASYAALPTDGLDAVTGLRRG